MWTKFHLFHGNQQLTFATIQWASDRWMEYLRYSNIVDDFSVFILLSMQFPKIHSYAYRLKALHRLKRPSLPTFTHQCLYCNILLPDYLTIFHGMWGKLTDTSRFPQSVSDACILNNTPHLCNAAAPLQSHSERESEQMQSAVSPSCSVQLCVGQRIYINAILITFQKTTNEVACLRGTCWVWKL